MVFWDIPGWGLGSVGMGTSLCSSSTQRAFHFDYGRHQSHFYFVESSFLVHHSFLFCWVRFGSKSFIVHVESLVVCSPLSLHMMYSLFHLVIWSFYSEYMLFSFSWVWFTYLALMCVMLSIWDIFSLTHHDHLDMTYHEGYWAYWPRIRRST